MIPYSFEMKPQIVRETGELSAVYFRFRKGQVHKTVEYADGRAFADYNVTNKLLGIEVIAPCNIRVIMKVVDVKDKAPVSSFVKRVAPRELVPA